MGNKFLLRSPIIFVICLEIGLAIKMSFILANTPRKTRFALIMETKEMPINKSGVTSWFGVVSRLQRTAHIPGRTAQHEWLHWPREVCFLFRPQCGRIFDEPALN